MRISDWSSDVCSSDLDQIDIHFKIAPKYYMYRERFGFATEPSSANDVLGVPEYPQGIVKYDPTFEKDLEVYHDQVTIRLPLTPGVAIGRASCRERVCQYV